MRRRFSLLTWSTCQVCNQLPVSVAGPSLLSNPLQLRLGLSIPHTSTTPIRYITPWYDQLEKSEWVKMDFFTN